jgi:hypothetical protein
MWFMDKKCDWFWYELMSTLGMLKKKDSTEISIEMLLIYKDYMQY